MATNRNRGKMNAPAPAIMQRDKRYLVIDFETNGIKRTHENLQPNDLPLPYENFPTQVSVDIVEHGLPSHAFDCYIRGVRLLHKRRNSIHAMGAGECPSDIGANGIWRGF